MKIDKLKLTQTEGGYVWNDIEKRICDQYDNHHSTLIEYQLVAMFEEIEAKINEIIEVINKNSL